MAHLIIHGGAGRMEGVAGRGREYRQGLLAAFAAAEELLRRTRDPRAAVLQAVRLLESNPVFNAGLGSRLQRDGRIRMSAALADGAGCLFSGVVNVTEIEHPIDLAERLAAEPHHVLAGEGATARARALGFPPFDPATGHRLEEYRRRLAGETGTVGAVAADDSGRIFAATSTGGVGYETPGRVSDSPTVAGTYATAAAGVSCTGTGEEIVNLAVAARIATRAADGMTLEESVRRTVEEGTERGFHFGLIALDRKGGSVVGETAGTRVMFARRGRGGEIEAWPGEDDG